MSQYSPIQTLLLDLFVKCMAEGLKEKELKLADARDSSKEFLALLDLTDPEVQKGKVMELVGQWECYRPMLISYMNREEEIMLKDVLHKMREHLKANNVDRAIKVATEGE